MVRMVELSPVTDESVELVSLFGEGKAVALHTKRTSAKSTTKRIIIFKRAMTVQCRSDYISGISVYTSAALFEKR
uniref:DNA repair protein RecO n=1 Tax=Steinernema glaseri TaxID=37863 RepID=A0A1I7YFR3_9BILA